MKSFRNIALAATVLSFSAFAQNTGSTPSTDPYPPSQQDTMEQERGKVQEDISPTRGADTAIQSKSIQPKQSAKYMIILPAASDQVTTLTDLQSGRALDKFTWSCEGDLMLSSEHAAALGASDTTAEAVDTTGKVDTTQPTTTAGTGAEALVEVDQCLGIMLTNATSESAALEKVPASVRSKAKAFKTYKFNNQDVKSLQSPTSHR